MGAPHCNPVTILLPDIAPDLFLQSNDQKELDLGPRTEGFYNELVRSGGV